MFRMIVVILFFYYYCYYSHPLLLSSLNRLHLGDVMKSRRESCYYSNLLLLFLASANLQIVYDAKFSVTNFNKQ